jgi:hypothetical protein
METTTTLEAPLHEERGGLLLGIPWYLYAILFGSVSIIVGLIWDVSWHMSIGRDTLLSPPHMAIYLGGAGSGIASGFKVLKTTFWGTKEEKEASVTIWGFKGPLGGWFCILGAIAMLTSAPFDDWWHNTYGLDVKILSPPHVVLLLGMITIQLGAFFIIMPAREQGLSLQDPNALKRNKRLEYMYTLAAGILIGMMAVTLDDYIYVNKQHSSSFYKAIGIAFPVFMLAVRKASGLKWAATLTALCYMVLVIEINWILQLFPAEPKLGPIRNQITHMVPMGFPLLLVVPGLLIDLVYAKWPSLKAWQQALVSGIGFIAVMLPVQWFMSMLILSPAGRNFFFMGHRWTYASNPDYPERYNFWQLESAPDFWMGIAWALAFAVLSSLVGIKWGSWMKSLKR